MPIIRVYISDECLKILEEEAKELGREIEDLASASVEGEAIQVKNFKREKAALNRARKMA